LPRPDGSASAFQKAALGACMPGSPAPVACGRPAWIEQCSSHVQPKYYPVEGAARGKALPWLVVQGWGAGRAPRRHSTVPITLQESGSVWIDGEKEHRRLHSNISARRHEKARRNSFARAHLVRQRLIVLETVRLITYEQIARVRALELVCMETECLVADDEHLHGRPGSALSHPWHTDRVALCLLGSCNGAMGGPTW
jgi:hypothetical protein